jgi:outer membrane receptor protein involved in Fe transport
MKKTYLAFSLFVCFFINQTLFAQYSIEGTVLNNNNQSLVGAHILLEPSNDFTTTNRYGNFKFVDLQNGSYSITVTYLGAKMHREEVSINGANVSLSINMEADPLNLDNVVLTGTKASSRQLESALTMTTLNSKDLNNLFSLGTADLLQNIPGMITDASAGEIFTKVYSRGISASSEDDMGWYYVSLQEDGLPVSLIQHSYYSPDLFHRIDLFTDKLEVLNGGTAATHSLNGPGGVYNFISRGARNELGGELQLSSGLQGKNNEIVKIEGVLGGTLGDNWYFNVGGHYRYDKGARTNNFTFSRGGQVKYNLIKRHNKGQLKFYGKILNDYTNRYTGVAATNWKNPAAAFGMDFNDTSLLMPEFDGRIPDGRKLSEGKINGFDPSNGAHSKDLVFGFDLDQDLGNDWRLKFNGKFSSKEADWQTSISNAFVSLSNPLAYFISGAQFPVGQVIFRDARSGEEMARVNNSGMFMGEPFEYLSSGNLPNDAIMGTAAWYKFIDADEWMHDISFSKKLDNHNLSFGSALGISNSSLFTQGSFGYATYEPSPRMLQVTLENPGQPVVALSDEHGLSNYGGLFFINADIKVRQAAFFINDHWTLNNKLTLDAGLRYEIINHEGEKDRYAPTQLDGGFDSDQTTAYDNGILSPTGQKDSFDYDYEYLSGSLGFNFAASKEWSLFSRFTRGNKAPEIDYYINNFNNVPINQKGEIQNITQLELGTKYNDANLATSATAFISWLDDIGISNFEFDPDDGSVFYTPVQFNSSRTIGLEWESVYSPISNFSLRFIGTIQDANAKDWTVYNASGTTDPGDDSIISHSDNKLPFTPNLLTALSVHYEVSKLSSYIKWQYFSEREGNIANTFQLPSYSLFSLGLMYRFNSRISMNLLSSNLFNSEGLTNFFGANSFGANADGATKEFIQSNPNASFVVVPVLPRRTVLKLRYTF